MSIDMNNDKFEHNQEFLRKIGDTINNMQAPLREAIETANTANQAIAAAMQAPLRQAIEAANAANQAIAAAMQSDALKNALQFGRKIAQTISAYNFAPMLKAFSEAMIPIKYIHLLERLKWPLFLVNDEELRDRILSACSAEEDAEAVKEIVFAYCDEAFLLSLEEDWFACSAINQNRKPILSEALQMHKQGFYYASVSILMCQLYGIAADIDNLAKENGLSLSQEDKEFIAERFEVDIRYINNEKGRLLQSLMLTESGMLLWDAMGDYIKNVTLYSGKDYSHIENQPLRNKIGHGDQLNFGTKEHSLKAILTIDMMIQLVYELNRIVEASKNQEVECKEGKE